METNVRDTSLEAFEDIRKKLKGTTQAVFEVILELGPTHNNRILEYLKQKDKLLPKHARRGGWQINQVCGRVNDLVNIHHVVVDMGKYRGSWWGQMKIYHLWSVRGDNRQPIGWVKIKEQKSEIRSQNPEAKKQELEAGSKYRETKPGQSWLF